MTPIRAAYLDAASATVSLVGHPAVVAAWAQPSALADFSVGGLAAHLANQVISVPRVLAAPPPTEPQVSLLEHYAKVTWIGAELDADINVVIRSKGEEVAADGPTAIVDQTAAAVLELTGLLTDAPAETLVSPPAGPWGLQLDEFLITRLMEIVVHSDDLACSVGLATPDFPAAVLDPVFDLLTRLAVRRHGATAVLRGLTRTERAPATISAF